MNFSVRFAAWLSAGRARVVLAAAARKARRRMGRFSGDGILARMV
jgi:hypothetical protein